MTRFIKLISILLLVTPFTYVEVDGFDPITLATVATVLSITASLIKIANDGAGLMKNSMRYFGDKPVENGPGHERHFNAEQDQLLAHLRSLSEANYEFKTSLETTKDEIISRIFLELPGLIELNDRLTKVFNYFDTVDSYFQQFVTYYEKPGFDKNKIIGFANSVTADGSLGLGYILDDIQRYLIKGYGAVPSSLTLLARHIEVFLENNRIAMSPQQLINDLLMCTLYAEMKGFYTIRYSYEVLDLHKQGNFSKHVEKLELDFGKRVNNTLAVFQQVMSYMSREISKNNPPLHVEGKTYTELKNVFQEFVINERDLNDDESCSKTCSVYHNPFKTNHYSCSFKGEICAVSQCHGTLHDCQLKVDSTMTICVSKQNSNRFFDFIDYNDGLRYGDLKAKCSTRTFTTDRHLKTFHWCDPCFCVCAHNTTKAERHFNLDPVRTNTAENYVVTGARLVKIKNMVHIQIREGQLLPNGRINTSTLQWSKINENPIHYYTLQWEEGREINFDDLNVPNNYILTGLSFASDISDSVAHTYRLHLKGFAAPLLYENGSLDLKHEMKFTNYDLFSSKEIKLKDRDIPTRNTAPTNLKSNNNEFLKFGPSGLRIDVGQSTIPFIDIQEVVTDPAVPMNSAGLFFRSRQYTGGFVALKLFSYDYSHRIKANLPENYTNFATLKPFYNKL